MTRVWVAIDSTNQPVLNSAWPACSRTSMTQKVRKSKIELIGPNTQMKFRMNFMSPAAGRTSCLGSTRSVGMTSCPALQSRLLRRICEGSIGKKERNTDAPAPLNMLPKFEDVAISTYFMVLPKMRRPSVMPSASRPRIFFEQHHVGGFLGHVGPRVNRDPDVGVMQRHHVVHPSPRNPARN